MTRHIYLHFAASVPASKNIDGLLLYEGASVCLGRVVNWCLFYCYILARTAGTVQRAKTWQDFSYFLRLKISSGLQEINKLLTKYNKGRNQHELVWWNSVIWILNSQNDVKLVKNWKIYRVFIFASATSNDTIGLMLGCCWLVIGRLWVGWPYRPLIRQLLASYCQLLAV